MKIICLVVLVAAGLVEARPKSQFGGKTKVSRKRLNTYEKVNQVCTEGVLMTSQCMGNDITYTIFLSQVNVIHGLMVPKFAH